MEAIGLIGTGIQAIGAIQQGQAAAEAARLQGQADRANAVSERQRAAEDERNFRIMSNKELGGMRASYGASGVTGGSVTDVLAESAANAELDARNIRKEGERKAQAWERGAALDARQASSASTTGYLKAAGDLASGGADYYTHTMKRV